MKSKQFHLGDVLSVTTGRLVAPELMDGVYKLFTHLTGAEMTTTGIMIAHDNAKAWLLSQFPQLKNVDTSSLDGPGSVLPWLEIQEALFGKYLDVEPMPPGYYREMNPVTEAVAAIKEAKNKASNGR